MGLGSGIRKKLVSDADLYPGVKNNGSRFNMLKSWHGIRVDPIQFFHCGRKHEQPFTF
jgi:hypothetical protein